MQTSCIPLLVLAMSFVAFPAHVSANEIDSSCLSIICKVSSNCDTERRCLGSGSAYCGPFQISRSYWQDAGSPGDTFQSCALNLSCSTSAVASYMKRYAKDCNKDAIIDCADYAAIHKAGANHCDDHWVAKSAFMQSFFSLSGRTAEASETDETRVSFHDHIHSDLRDFRRVRTRPTPLPPARRRVSSPPGYPLPDILTALRPWIVDAAEGTRGNRRPANEVQPSRRRRVRPQPRPNDVPRTTIRPIVTSSRPTPPSVTPTRRRFRPTVTIASTITPSLRPFSRRPAPTTTTTVAPVTVPWWRLATTPAFTIRNDPVTSIATTTRLTTTVTTEATRMTSTTRAPITRRVTVRSTTAAVSTSTASTTTSESTTTTRKPTTKPTFNPIRVNSTTPSVNDVEVNQDVPFKSNSSVKTVPLSAACMECMCIASSGCNFDPNLKCYGEEECGPYRIDYAYWYEAGYPGYKGRDDDFANCARNQTCAEEAVTSYVTSKSKDCNEDGVIDCLDYASTHKAGPDACNTAYMFDSKFWAAFTACYGFEEREMSRRRK